jgi:hypothetical protein
MELFLETELENWNQLFLLDRFYWSSFIFRGQANKSWDLVTSIERAKKSYSLLTTYTNEYTVEEQWMMHEFKRKYPLFSSILPKQTDSFEWLAIMQHHGAPTRLLDFTESIFIATYFATVEASEDCSVWAINRINIRDNIYEAQNLNYVKHEALKDDVNDVHIEYANKFIGNKTEIDCEQIPITVIPLEPKICTERLARQQGLFLMPTNSNNSFIENLAGAFSEKEIKLKEIKFEKLLTYKSSEFNKIKILKINISKDYLSDISDSLRQMNITAETLFPGVDGLAKSLQQTHIRS